ncbi:MAG: hypothetical protein V3S55_09595 [Nitrospiraceae bacterium]
MAVNIARGEPKIRIPSLQHRSPPGFATYELDPRVPHHTYRLSNCGTRYLHESIVGEG